ncbi:MAG: WG repeat-containing protein [Hyphomicrobiales bacterium]|nr:WG repeat-containing protein [Hyphomicrobiales bacterium]
MKLRHLLIAFITIGSVASSEVNSADKILGSSLRPQCYGIYHLCGYHDRKTKAEIIPRRYERALPFSDGLAAVRINGYFGFIDSSGKEVIKPRFDLAGPFFQGHAEVLINGRVGVVDRSGKLALEPQFARAIPFTSEVMIVSEGQWQSRHFPGRDGFDGLSSGNLYFGNRPVGLYHLSKGWIKKPRFTLKLFEAGGRGLIWATEGRSSKGPWGLLRADGTWQVEPIYSHVQSLADGRAIVRQSRKASEKLPPSGAVDENGQLVVPIEFAWLSYWKNGYALTRKNGREGLVDKNGHLLGGRYFEKVYQNLINGEWSQRILMDGIWKSVVDGAIVEDQREGKVQLTCPSGLTIRYRSGKLEFIAPGGEPVTDVLFDSRWFFPRDCGAPLNVSAGGKWGFVTQDGRLLTDPLKFENQFGFNDDHAAVKINGRWGVIDLNGNFTIDPIFDKIHPHSSGVFEVTQGSETNWRDGNGRKVLAPDEHATARRSIVGCRDGARLINRGGGWGMVGPDGKIIIQPKYRAIDCFRQGVVWVPDDKQGAWCPLGPDAQRREQPKCRQTYYPYIQTHSFPERFARDAYESSVRWVKAYLNYGIGRRDKPPRMIPDGSQPSHSILR